MTYEERLDAARAIYYEAEKPAGVLGSFEDELLTIQVSEGYTEGPHPSIKVSASIDYQSEMDLIALAFNLCTDLVEDVDPASVWVHMEWDINAGFMAASASLTSSYT